MNGVVEHMQDTSSRWAQVNDCDTYEELQQRLEEEAIVQRTMFPVSRLKNKTRLQAFPQLEKSTRQFTEPGLCAQLVYEFLAKKSLPEKSLQMLKSPTSDNNSQCQLI